MIRRCEGRSRIARGIWTRRRNSTRGRGVPRRDLQLYVGTHVRISGKSLTIFLPRKNRARLIGADIDFLLVRLAEAEVVKTQLAAAVVLLSFLAAGAQEVTLPPIVVTGTFELRQGPSVTDLFTQHLQKQIQARRALEEAAARSPVFNARFWSYIPMRLESSSSDSSLFFTPSYLSTDYRNAERALQESRKQSLFEPR